MKEKTKKIVKTSVFATIVAGALIVVYLTFKSNVNKEDAERYKSPYFTVEDMFKSHTARVKSIDNTTTDKETLLNIHALFMKVLDPVRKRFGRDFTINSGYRSAQLNKAVGGASSSQHMKGEAADIDAGSRDENRRLFELIRELGVYDQLIDESGYKWVHVSYKRIGYNRNQILHKEYEKG